MDPILVSLIFLSALHFAGPYTYYLHMKLVAGKKALNITENQNYEPKLTIIIPTYNESLAIANRLQNLRMLDYPRNKLEVIVIDSASTDGTANIVKGYIEDNGFPFKIQILEEEQRRGKSKALNHALQYANGEIIATSDADSYWDPSALKEALRCMALPQVGAVTGREVFLNYNQNIYTFAEVLYRRFYNILRIGESKLDSTLIFQGELSLYKREAFEKFEDEKGSDDTGTVINIISKGYHCLFVPSAVFYDTAPYTWRGRITVKARRAQHLIYALAKAAKLKIKKKLPISTVTVFSNLYLHTINPILSIALPFCLLYLLYTFPFLFPIAILLALSLLVKRVRAFFVSYLSSNIALLAAIISCIKGDRQIIWRKVERSQAPLQGSNYA